MSRSPSDCQELYRHLLRILDERPTGGNVLFYIRALRETVECDHISDKQFLRRQLYQRLDQNGPGTIQRVTMGDYEPEDQSHAMNVMTTDRFRHQRELARGLPMSERLWYWTVRPIWNFLQGGSSSSHGHYPG